MHDSRLGEGKAGDIDVAWGKQGTAEKNYSDGFGLAHIIAKHGEGILSRIADIIANGALEVRKSKKPEEVPPTAKAAVTTNGGKSAEAIVP